MQSTFSSFRASTESLVSGQNPRVLTLLSADEPINIIRDITSFIQCSHLWAKHKCLLLQRCPKAKLWTQFPIHLQMLPFLVNKVDPVSLLGNLIWRWSCAFQRLSLTVIYLDTIITVTYLAKYLRNNVFKLLKFYSKKDDCSDQI